MSNGAGPEFGGFSQAESSLAEAQRLINEEAQANPDKKKSKGRIRSILSNVSRVVNALENVGALHPAAKLVFEVYKGLLKLENDRRDNSEQIVILFHSMARTLSVLSYLDKMVIVADDPLTVHLGEVLHAFAMSMEEFGDLSDLYYNKCKHPVVRFMKATEFKGKLGHFQGSFSRHRRDLQEILVIRNEVRTGEMSQGIEQLRANTEMILARLGEPSSEQEIQALEIVRLCGRDRVLHDKSKLEELSTLVGGGKVSGNTQALLDTNLDDMLAANMEQFHRKLDSSMTQISDSVNKSRDAILKKLDSGPHELIDDPDVQAVWKGNSWKLSVKCRHFVDELSNHYEDKFRNEAAEEGANCNDHWTLPIFSKVMHHPAIGDAIDEDGSGFISLYEVTCWLKERPTGWSVTEWLVYWAIGWKMNNVRFNEAIVDSLEEIRERCKTISESSNDEDVQHQVKQYLAKIQIMEKISSWSDSAHAEDTQDLSHEAEAKLQNLLDQSSKQQVAMVTERLEELKWILDDPADIPVLLGGSDARIEQVFLSIAQLILGKQLEELDSRELADGDWEIMTETLEMLIAVFHDRMQSLLRGWRAQKLNVELHITCFAGGIYNGWYTAYYHPSGEMKRILEKNPVSHQAGSQDSSQADTLSTILTQMGHLTERVDHVDSRIDDIFAMLRTLLEANSTQSASNHAKKEDVRNSLLASHLSPKKVLSEVPRKPQSPAPEAIPAHTNKVAPTIAGHARTARRVLAVGGTMLKLANKANGLLDGEVPENFSIPREVNPVGGMMEGFANKTGALLNGEMQEDLGIPTELPSAGGMLAGFANTTGALLNGEMPEDLGIPTELPRAGGMLAGFINKTGALLNGEMPEDLGIPTELPRAGGMLAGFANKTGALLNGEIPQGFSIPKSRFPKGLISVGGKMAGFANKAGALANGEVPAGTSAPKEVVSDGDDFDFIVDNYAARPDGLEFPRIKDALSRSQTSPETEETPISPGQQTPQEYGNNEVLVAERTEPFNDFYTPAISKGVSVDRSELLNGSLAWPSSAGVTKTYTDYFNDHRPRTAPIVPTMEDMTKKLKHKKSGGIKGVKDTIRSRLTSFGSKSTSQGDRDSGERVHAVSSVGHQNSSDSTNHGRSQEFGALPQRHEVGSPRQRQEFNSPPQRQEVRTLPQRQEFGSQPQRQQFASLPQRQDFDRVEPQRQPWDGREYRDARTGLPLSNDGPPNTNYGGNARRSDGPVNYHTGRGGTGNVNYSGNPRRSDGAQDGMNPTTAIPLNQPRTRHPTGPRSVAANSPTWRNGWNGSPQWEGQYQQQQQPPPTPNYGTAL